MPKGYYTEYSYAGIMPDGKTLYFISDSEYLEAYEEEMKTLNKGSSFISQ